MVNAVTREPVQRQIQVNEVGFRVYEWPGKGDPLLFLHATGFHSRCWNQVIAQLPNAHIYAVDMHFHGGTQTKGEIDWSRFSVDVAALIVQLNLNNIIGVGHSMGGCVIARTAAVLPDRFKQLLLIDPVIMGPDTRKSFQSAAGKVTAAEHPVAFRKNNWRSSNEMFERFRSKPPFDSWRIDVLKDYCDYALDDEADENDEHALACKPADEAAFYLSSTDYDIIRSEISHINTPTTVLRAPPPAAGETADFSASPTWPELTSVMQQARDVYLPDCNHFIPMQKPELVTDYVRQAINGNWT